MLKRILLIAITGIFVICVQAQTTEFTYQGILKDGADPANGNYDLEFRLYDAAVDGTQIGMTASRPNVAIVDGLVSAILDFGSGFPGADRFLEIRIRNTGGGGFTILDPRQKVASSPYSIRSLGTEDAEKLGGVDANDYLLTNGSGASLTNLNAGSITTGVLPASRGGTGVAGVGPNGTFLRSNGSAWAVSGIQAIDIPPGSVNYIRNSGTQQASSQFNISGTGTADIFNAATQFNIGNNRVLSAGGSGNLSAGVGAGDVNTGLFNSFFGRNAGQNNMAGTSNSFFGNSAGASNTTGNNNSFFGVLAGMENVSGSSNTFIGRDSGAFNTLGDNNAYIGANSGTNNSTGSNNTLIGRGANVGSGALTFATAIGSNAVVTASNRIQLGRAGQDNVAIGLLAAATSTHLCINASLIAACSSSRRYKTNIENFNTGLDLVKKLQPVTFDWIKRGEPDLGLIAEEVEEVEPLLATYNEKGEIQGVKYPQLSIVLINAVKQQQAQIEALRKRVKRQEQENEALRSYLCKQDARAEPCRPMT